jgi:hypothetical protein
LALGRRKAFWRIGGENRCPCRAVYKYDLQKLMECPWLLSAFFLNYYARSSVESGRVKWDVRG